MNKKETFSRREIEKDIADFIKYPPGNTESKNKRFELIPIAVIVALAAAVIIYPPFVFVIILLLIIGAIAVLTFLHLREKHLIKNISLDDYRVTKKVVRCVYIENYTVNRSGYKGRTHHIEVYNYSIHFEDGSKWRIPGRCYSWSERYRMYNRKVCESTHMGDTMTVITKKETDEIVVAYNAEFFEYKGNLLQ